MSLTSPWHPTFTDALREAINIGWLYAAQDGRPAVELATLVIEPEAAERGAYILMGNQIVNAQGRVCARLSRDKPQARTPKRRRRAVG
ncbi:hypothetical protein GCM10008956_30560 [Deinococcus arenae]|uniref:Uncharacterized protein n=1 Tax=Deinococcus arenae TaxID=1452751 RepID=A0A8H9GVV7_9DEIO|nr:hypothetical protein [Deinococcus arenae]GGM52370.1 hypothetical protein GCM10008956_30560 [Deinococcus arenae]